VTDGLHAAEHLELVLGDPYDPQARMTATATLEDDERERFPERAYAQLQAWRFTQFFVPAESGGALTSFEEALMLLRIVSRRDLTCAIALGQTYLGAIPIWLSGDARQRRRAAALIDAGDAFAFALTERDHGSDVLANDVCAEPVPGGYRLRGEKWLINNGTRARALTVFARTGEPGPRGYSLFLVEIDGLAPNTYEHTPKIRTHGIRGADISGIRFDSAFVGADAMIGPVGGGLELALKGLMITRMMCAGFALGAADTALRLAVRFAAQRHLYGSTVAALADPRRTLAECFADLLGADVLACSAVRAAHVDPRSLSVNSAIVKFAVPSIVESLVDRCASVLGARSYVRDLLPWALFQKTTRDVRVVGLFDGSAGVNLHVIVTQLPHLARRLTRSQTNDGGSAARLETIFDERFALPPFDGSRIELSARGQDDVLAGLAGASAELAALARSDSTGGAAITTAAGIAADLSVATTALCAEVATFGTHAERMSAAAFACARRYCYLHAAAALVQRYLADRRRAEDPAAYVPALTPNVFVLALSGLAARAGCPPRALPESTYEEVAATAAKYDRLERLFSTTSIRIADAVAASGELHEAMTTV
jgi:alkylation response protein AidB-like acyl-CoA dehydrogenase